MILINALFLLLLYRDIISLEWVSNFVDPDILSLEWVPRFVEDSYCEESHNEESGAAYSSSYVTKEDSMHNQFHIAS